MGNIQSNVGDDYDIVSQLNTSAGASAENKTERTNFHRIEYKLLKQLFRRVCLNSEKLVVSRNEFCKLLFPEKIMLSPQEILIRDAIFSAFSSSNESGVVSWSNFVASMSAAVRGSIDQRINLTYKIYNISDSVELSRSDVKKYISAMIQANFFSLPTFPSNKYPLDPKALHSQIELGIIPSNDKLDNDDESDDDDDDDDDEIFGKLVREDDDDAEGKKSGFFAKSKDRVKKLLNTLEKGNPLPLKRSKEELNNTKDDVQIHDETKSKNTKNEIIEIQNDITNNLCEEENDINIGRTPDNLLSQDVNERKLDHDNEVSATVNIGLENEVNNFKKKDSNSSSFIVQSENSSDMESSQALVSRIRSTTALKKITTQVISLGEDQSERDSADVGGDEIEESHFIPQKAVPFSDLTRYSESYKNLKSNNVPLISIDKAPKDERAEEEEEEDEEEGEDRKDKEYIERQNNGIISEDTLSTTKQSNENDGEKTEEVTIICKWKVIFENEGDLVNEKIVIELLDNTVNLLHEKFVKNVRHYRRKTRRESRALSKLEKGKIDNLSLINPYVEEFFGNNLRMGFEKFRERCYEIPILIEGCGTFENILVPIFKKVEEFLHSENPFEMSGILKRVRNSYFHQIKGGVMRRFKSSNKEKEIYKKSINLKTCIDVEEHLDKPESFTIIMGKNNKKMFTAPTIKERESWVFTITLYIMSSHENRYGSFAPVRKNASAKWFVDGKDAFEAIRKAILMAREQIFFTGWAFQPLLYLKRDTVESNSRVDRILLHKANQGVKIFILIWREASIAGMALESDYQKNFLNSLHPNIKAITHTKAVTGGLPSPYSHHQKTIVVDQEIGFLGGLDLWWGRYDDHSHRLIDNNHYNLTWPGLDFQNCRLFGGYPRQTTKQDAFRDAVDRDKIYRMPWHDVHCCVYGELATDLAVNFISRWNHHIQSLYITEKLELSNEAINKSVRSNSVMRSEIFQALFSLNKEKKDIDILHGTTSNHQNVSTTKSDAKTIFGRKVTLPTFSKLRNPVNNTPNNKEIRRNSLELKNNTSKNSSGNCTGQIVRSLDIWSGNSQLEASIYNAMLGMIEKAEHYIYIENQYFISSTANPSVVFNTIALAIVDKIRQAIRSKKIFRVIIVLPVHPEGSFFDSPTQQVMKWQYRTICRSRYSIFSVLRKEFPSVKLEQYISFFCLRNYDFLSTEFDRPVTEQVYVHCKLMIVDDKYCMIGSANINDRSLLGSRDSEIAVVINDTDTSVSRMNGQIVLVGKFAKSLRKQLWKEHLGLLKEGVDNQHKKVDEFNSEIKQQESLKNKGRNAVNKVKDAISKQKNVFEQKLHSYEIDDPVADASYNGMLRSTAKHNTQIFQSIFPFIPSDSHATLESLINAQRKYDISMSKMSSEQRKNLFASQRKLLQENIKGFITIFPLRFLEKEPLKKSATLRVLDDSIFT